LKIIYFLQLVNCLQNVPVKEFRKSVNNWRKFLTIIVLTKWIVDAMF